MNRLIVVIPCAIPALLVLAVAHLPTFGWDSLLLLGGTALALPLVFSSVVRNR